MNEGAETITFTTTTETIRPSIALLPPAAGVQMTDPKAYSTCGRPGFQTPIPMRLSLVTGVRNIYKLLSMGTLPFIVGDVAKVLAAAALAKGITPKQAYNGEVDAGFSNKQ